MDYNSLINDNEMYLYKIEGFSSIRIKLNFKVENNLKNFIGLKLLSSYIFENNKVYNTVPKIQTRIKELYNFFIGSGSYTFGKYLMFEVNIHFLNKYVLNDEYYLDLMTFINDMLFKVKYNKKSLKDIKNRELNYIKSYLKNENNIMYLEYLKYNFKDTTEYNYSLNNKDEIIKIINEYSSEDLKELHDKIFKNFYKGLIMGNVSDEDYKLFRKFLNFKSNIKKLDYIDDEKLMKKNKDYEIVSDKTNLSRIYITYRFKKRDIALLDFINNIMNSSHGPLFSILRSKYGLVYSFGFSYKYYKRRILISAQIDKNNKDKFISGVEEAFNLMKNKTYVKKLLNEDKQAYKDDLYTLEENMNRMFKMSFEHIMKPYENYDQLEFLNNLDKYNEEDIINYFNTFERTNIFFYKGVMKDE